jgi:hypothetical protein
MDKNTRLAIQILVFAIIGFSIYHFSLSPVYLSHNSQGAAINPVIYQSSEAVTYTNQQYRFRFMYPGNWARYENVGRFNVALFPEAMPSDINPNNVLEYYRSNNVSIGISVVQGVVDPTRLEELNETEKEYVLEYTLLEACSRRGGTSEPLLIGGLDGIICKLILSEEWEGAKLTAPAEVVLVIRGADVFGITITPQINEVMEDILDSFEFF